MLTIEVELLTGRYVATASNDRGRAEWPPHPARFYSALVAALHERVPVDHHEKAALRWLEAREPPSLKVDLDADNRVGRRDVKDVYVPVNDITLVGDVGKAVREAEADLARLSTLAPDKSGDKQSKMARQDLEKAHKQLQALANAQQVVPQRVSAEELKRAYALVPEHRLRQVRTFPVVTPQQPRFFFQWDTPAPPEVAEALALLCERVTRLGHSSSLVRCALVEHPIEVNLVPERGGEYVLRTVGAGQLERLEAAFEKHQGVDGRVLPSRATAYARANHAAPLGSIHRTVMGEDWIVFERVEGAPRLLASKGRQLASALRKALIEIHGSRTLPASIAGHGEDGRAAESPHVAFVPLPFVGHEHADASIQGIALVPPRDFSPSDREALLRLIGKWEAERGTGESFTLELAGEGLVAPWRMRRADLPEKDSLRARRWCRPAQRFVTATPIALDRFPGALRVRPTSTLSQIEADAIVRTSFKRAARSIAQSCENIGLPRPISVDLDLAPLLVGVEGTNAFRGQPEKAGRPSRTLVHAKITFAELVRGPVLLGAGRYFGLGLCLPCDSESSNRTRKGSVS